MNIRYRTSWVLHSYCLNLFSLLGLLEDADNNSNDKNNDVNNYGNYDKNNILGKPDFIALVQKFQQL